MPRCGTRNDENWRYNNSWVSPVAKMKAVPLWCFEPEDQSGLGIVANPKLLPPLVGEHARQIVASFDSLFATEQKRKSNHGHHLLSRRGAGSSR